MYSNYKKWFPLDTFSSGLNVQKQAILNICVNGNKREICNIYTTFHPRVILSGPGQEVEDGHRLTGADSHSAQPRLITPSVQPAPVSEVRADNNPQSWHPVSCCQQWKCCEKPILICELNSRVKFHASKLYIQIHTCRVKCWSYIRFKEKCPIKYARRAI